MNDLIPVLVGTLIRGIQVGLVAGLLAGAITWSIIKMPESLFKGLFGFILGFIGFALFRGQDLAELWGQMRAIAGGSIPRVLAEYTINLGYQAIIGGLIGMVFVLAISGPANTIRGAMIGGLLGTIIGIILQIVVTMTGLPIDSIYYAPLSGLIVLIVFAVFGAGA
jgi:hypothetical protein